MDSSISCIIAEAVMQSSQETNNNLQNGNTQQFAFKVIAVIQYNFATYGYRAEYF
ncbi:hypothetical protein PHET_11076 [Paragonimus heterotremus]|uniref:Uncharacterized protein n=1 Tax=Paragonimus heterotremus TaxID=100268 RepID=A0A8J4WTJ3_9TREM|nr:hypothetical protein PHET_11076 [Paragonimus heterotremus]